MRRELVAFKAEHYAHLAGQAEPGFLRLTPEQLAALEGFNSYTVLVDGQVAAVAGTWQQWPTRHICWAMLDPILSRDHMDWITKLVIATLSRLHGRIELTVRADFPRGQKWAEMLGFKIETPLLTMYGPQGEDHVGYFKVN